MSISMYSASAPIFVRMLGNLASWLDKAEAHAAEKKFETQVYLQARLAPDMLDFTTQIQIACDTAKFCVARLAGIEAPAFEDKEKTIAELRQRIMKTIDFVKSVPADSIDGSEAREITIKRRDGPVTMTGEVYLKHVALPNLFFHVTTAYALLRHNGVAIGKSDYLGV